MGFKRGDVHLVNFNPSKGTEAGKIRPALILQANTLNDADHHQARAIDNQRITSEPLTSLSEVETATIERYMKIILGFEQ